HTPARNGTADHPQHIRGAAAQGPQPAARAEQQRNEALGPYVIEFLPAAVTAGARTPQFLQWHLLQSETTSGYPAEFPDHGAHKQRPDLASPAITYTRLPRG